MKNFFKKLEYHYLVESTKTENVTFLYKTTLSEANVKRARMGSTKWTNHKERSSRVTSIFSKKNKKKNNKEVTRKVTLFFVLPILS